MSGPLGRAADFFRFLREREAVRIAKDSGLPKPWTNDPVLRDFYFCNVFREDDRVTRWFRENVRDPLARDNRVIMATIAFRWFNYIPTGVAILDTLLTKGYDRALFERALRPIRDRGEKLFTGAFMINSAPVIDKLTSILDCLDAAKEITAGWKPGTSLEVYHADLRAIPRLGNFMAYQVVCDLRFTSILWDATDINEWSSAGPGAARGLVHVFDCPLFAYGSEAGQEQMLDYMKELLEWSRLPGFWPKEWRPMELSTIQHSLCEYDKYRRGQLGTRLKRGYPQR